MARRPFCMFESALVQFKNLNCQISGLEGGSLCSRWCNLDELTTTPPMSNSMTFGCVLVDMLQAEEVLIARKRNDTHEKRFLNIKASPLCNKAHLLIKSMFSGNIMNSFRFMTPDSLNRCEPRYLGKHLGMEGRGMARASVNGFHVQVRRH